MSCMGILETKRVLENVYDYSRSFVIPCLLGDPGIGKSQAVYELAEEKGVDIVEIIASQILPNEVSGITMPVDKTHSMEIYDHAKLSSLKDGDILFFDELLQAAPQTLAACLTLLQERKLLSGKKLPDVMIVAAANPLNSADQIPLSIRQRFMFLNVRCDLREWRDYMVRVKGFDEQYVAKMATYVTAPALGNYNLPTPRTLEKLMSWGDNVWKESKDISKIKLVIRYVEENFGEGIAKTMDDHYIGLHSKFQKERRNDEVVSVVTTYVEDEQQVRDILDNEGMSGLLAWLQGQPWWHKLEEELRNINVSDLEEGSL